MKIKNYFQDHKLMVCPVSGDKDFKKIFSLKNFPIYMGTVNKNFKVEKKNMNFYVNQNTGSVQIFPRVDLSKLYFKSHGSGKIGKLWSDHHSSFVNFIKLKSNSNILEIGGGHNSISLSNKKKKNVRVFSFDPNRNKTSRNEILIKDFFSEVSINKYKMYNKFDLAIHSHLFEHIYDPESFLSTIYSSLKKNGFHVFTVPSMEKMIKKNFANAMNFEHPFFLNEKMIKLLLAKTGFKIIEKKYFGNCHSIFYRTIKVEKRKKISMKNDYKKNFKLFKNLNKNWKADVLKINKLINKKYKTFLFGAHIFSQNLIQNGLNLKNISGIVDNDTDKQNEYLYGTNLKVFSPKILQNKYKPCIILRAGAYNKEIKNQLISINETVKFL